MHLKFRFLSFLLPSSIFLLSCFSGCATNPVSGKQEIRLFSDDDEITLGSQTKQVIIKEYGEYSDPGLKQYIEDVGRRLVASSERKYLPYNFTILDTDMINAFAAPGGCIFVTRGILKAFENEAELAAVVGHEIGHVSARHSMGALEKQYGYEIMFKLAEILSKKDLASLKQYSDTLSGLILLGYGRENEFEADNCGVKYAVAAGFDGRGAVTFFQKLEKLEGSKPTQLEMLFRTHPSTDDRIAKIKQYLVSIGYQPPANAANDGYKQRVQALP
ncbi:MAG: M48 family metallopeptidase [Elusimicrobiota bacterium]